MTERPDGDEKLFVPQAVEGLRKELEREYVWLVALDGDPVRKELLSRMLTPAANDGVRVEVVQVDPAGRSE